MPRNLPNLSISFRTLWNPLKYIIDIALNFDMFPKSTKTSPFLRVARTLTWFYQNRFGPSVSLRLLSLGDLDCQSDPSILLLRGWGRRCTKASPQLLRFRPSSVWLKGTHREFSRPLPIDWSERFLSFFICLDPLTDCFRCTARTVQFRLSFRQLSFHQFTCKSIDQEPFVETLDLLCALSCIFLLT